MNIGKSSDFQSRYAQLRASWKEAHHVFLQGMGSKNGDSLCMRMPREVYIIKQTSPVHIQWIIFIYRGTHCCEFQIYLCVRGHYGVGEQTDHSQKDIQCLFLYIFDFTEFSIGISAALLSMFVAKRWFLLYVIPLQGFPSLSKDHPSLGGIFGHSFACDKPSSSPEVLPAVLHGKDAQSRSTEGECFSRSQQEKLFRIFYWIL